MRFGPVPLDQAAGNVRSRRDRLLEASDWTQVLSMRVGLLVRSQDGIATSPQAYEFAGSTVNTSTGTQDSRLRFSAWGTFGIRNRTI